MYSSRGLRRAVGRPSFDMNCASIRGVWGDEMRETDGSDVCRVLLLLPPSVIPNRAIAGSESEHCQHVDERTTGLVNIFAPLECEDRALWVLDRDPGAGGTCAFQSSVTAGRWNAVLGSVQSRLHLVENVSTS